MYIVFVGHFHKKAHKFMVIGCSPTSKLRHFFKQFFRTSSEILFTDIKLYGREGPNIQKTLLIEHSFRIKIFYVTAHCRAVSQAKQNVEIVTFYHVLTPALHGPTLKQKSGHTTRVITSNCTKFLKYSHKILLLEIMQNASSTTRYFF